MGAAWIDLRRDLISAVYHWRRGELGPVDWFRSLRGPTAHAVLSVSDPLPFMHEIGHSLRKATSRAIRRRRSGGPDAR